MNLDAFCDWCKKKIKELAPADYVGELTVHNSEGKSHSACLDVEAGEVMARITFWKEGYADLEILDVSTGENIYYRHFERVDDFELDFKEFMNLLKHD